MKKDWKIKKLVDIGKIFNGNSINAKVKKEKYLNREEDGIPYIATKDVSYKSIIDYNNGISIPFEEKSNFKIASENTILICAEGGSAGRKIGFTNQDVCFGNKLFAFSANEKIESKYVYYYYFSNEFQKDFHSQMTGIIGGVSMNKFKNLQIPIPPLTQQKQIVKILDQAFTAIELAKNNAQQNLLNAKQLFESYLQNVFVNGKLKVESGEWVEKSLGEITNVTYGFTDKSTEEGDYRYVRITDIDKNGELIPTGKKYINSSKDGKDFILKENDILMARTGATFAKLLLYKDIEPSIYASYLIKIDFTEDIDNEFYWFFSKTNSYWEQANALSTGAAQPHFNGKALKQVVFSYPKSLKEQKKLIKEFRKLQAQTKKLESIYEQKIADLEELKKSILQKAFSGELTQK